MPPLRNQVFPLTITTLAPLHINSGARLLPNVDYYADGERVVVVDADVALDLVAQRWEAEQPAPGAQRQQEEAALDAEAAQIQRRRERNIRELTAFENAPPRDRQKAKQREEQLVREATQIKSALANLKERRTHLATAPELSSASLPDALVQNSGLSDLLKTRWLTLDDLRGPPSLNGRPLVRYTMTGRPNGDLYELIKDLADRPYLPGSSLKGALRSALAWVQAGSLPPTVLQQIGNGAKFADNAIEAAIFNGQLGPDRQKLNQTLRDVLRTLHVGDSGPVAVAPELLTVQVFQSKSAGLIDLEAIPAGTCFQATLQVERYPFENEAAKRVISFGDWQKRLAPTALAQACRERAAALLTDELAYFARFPEAAEVTRFYHELAAQLAQLGPRAFMLPVGWGAGWRSKTLDTRLRTDAASEDQFATTVQRFRLKKHKSERFRPGDSFPDTRKLALAGGRPWRPLGWLQVEIGEERTR